MGTIPQRQDYPGAGPAQPTTLAIPPDAARHRPNAADRRQAWPDMR